MEKVEQHFVTFYSPGTSNMECNGYKRIITNCNSWRWTVQLDEKDVVLDFVMPRRRKGTR